MRTLRMRGDWTFTHGLRPSVELHGVTLDLAVPLHASPEHLPLGAASPASNGAASKVTAAALRRVLRYVVVDVRDVALSVHEVAPGGAHAGLHISAITFGGGAESVAAGGVDDAFTRAVAVQTGPLFWVPREAPRRRAVRDPDEWHLLEPLSCSVRALPHLFFSAGCFSSSFVPCNCVEAVQATLRVAPGSAGPQRLALEASMACIEVAVSPRQAADVARIAAHLQQLTLRSRYAHFRTPALDRLLCPQAAASSSSSVSAEEGQWQLPSPLPLWPRPWAEVWRFATLAIRSDLRRGATAASARATRGARFARHYRCYAGACAVLYAARGHRGASESLPAEGGFKGLANASGVDAPFLTWVAATCGAAAPEHDGDESSAGSAGAASCGEEGPGATAAAAQVALAVLADAAACSCTFDPAADEPSVTVRTPDGVAGSLQPGSAGAAGWRAADLWPLPLRSFSQVLPSAGHTRACQFDLRQEGSTQEKGPFALIEGEVAVLQVAAREAAFLAKADLPPLHAVARRTADLLTTPAPPPSVEEDAADNASEVAIVAVAGGPRPSTPAAAVSRPETPTATPAAVAQLSVALSIASSTITLLSEPLPPPYQAQPPRTAAPAQGAVDSVTGAADLASAARAAEKRGRAESPWGSPALSAGPFDSRGSSSGRHESATAFASPGAARLPHHGIVLYCRRLVVLCCFLHG